MFFHNKNKIIQFHISIISSNHMRKNKILGHLFITKESHSSAS